MRIFTDATSGFSTSDLRDVDGQILQVNTANELIWTPDGTKLPRYTVDVLRLGDGPVYFINGPICPAGCAFEVRFGTADGERRAYLTVDYGHDNPGTLVNVDVAGGALAVTPTEVFPPGTFTLSGVVTELTATGPTPVEGVAVHRVVTTGWQTGTTDRNGTYRIQGLPDGTRTVTAMKEGYETQQQDVSVNRDTRYDILVVRR